MKVLVVVVYAHPDPDSFTHAILEHVTRGLAEGGHELTVNDLYAIGFDPVFTQHDGTQFLHESLPDELLERANLPEAVMRTAKDPVRRYLARRWLRGKSPRDIATAIAERQPKDVREQQQLVAGADGLVFVAPVFWMGFPAMLKGWFERVFAYGFAYTLTREGWQGDLDGRVPLLSQQKALILTPTFFTEEEYDKGWRSAMDTVLCDWGLRMAGVQQAHHHYFYAVLAADDERRRAYLEEATDSEGSSDGARRPRTLDLDRDPLRRLERAARPRARGGNRGEDRCAARRGQRPPRLVPDRRTRADGRRGTRNGAALRDPQDRPAARAAAVGARDLRPRARGAALPAWLRARRGARRQPGRDLFPRPGSTSTDPTIQGEAQGSASRPVQPLRAPRPRPRRPSVPAQEARAAPCAGRPNLRLRALDAALQGRSEQLLFPDIRIAAYPTFVEEMQAAGVQVFLQ